MIRFRAMTQRSQVLDLYFIDARSKLLDLCAFLDRLERADGAGDYRQAGLEKALGVLADPDLAGRRAQQALLALSDPTSEPVPHSLGKAATGAWTGTEAPLS